MLRLVHADRTGPLLDALAEDVAAARRAVGPLEALPIAIDGSAMRAHVEQGLALRLGIAAHLDLGSLRSFVADALAQSAPGVEIAGPGAIGGALLDLLHQPALLERGELAPVARYLDADDPDAVDDRRVDLARALGALFDGYLLDRPEWATRWRRGDPAPPGTDLEEWSWQGALFRRLVDPDAGPFAPVRPDPRAPRRRWLLPDALDRLTLTRAPPRLFVFDAAVHSPTIARALAAWSARADIYVYALTPCLELWDDLPGRTPAQEAIRRLGAPDPSGGESAARPDGPPALRLWGRPSREAFHLLSELAGWNGEGRFRVPGTPPASLLDAFRQDVLLRAPERRRGGPEPTFSDGSVRVLSAPGTRRECEAIAAAIWELLEARPDLRLSDVVVALGSSDADAYRTHLAAAFAEAGDLPAHGLEVPVASESRFIDAVRLLIALPGARFTRQDVLRILTHPLVRARQGVGDTDDWTAWCERLGIVHGADHADHAGTYLEKDLFNWDQGLRRLALGAFMAGEGAGRLDPVSVGDRHALPTDFAAHEIPSAGRLVALVRSLVGDARSLAETETTLPEWAVYLRHLVDTYVGTETDDDERDRYRVFSALEELGRTGSGAVRVRFRTAARLLDERLARLRAQRGHPLAEAVVVGPLALVASLPFRVAFLPGLGESRFPAPSRPSALDLRRGERRPGELSPRMRDEHAFLLRILATQDTVCLSYVGRDPRTGDALAPASTLAELLGILERGYLEDAGGLVETVPLRRLDAPGPSAIARAEAGARALGADLDRHLGPGVPRPDLDGLRTALPPARFERLARRLRLPPLPEKDGSSPGEAKRRVSLAHLQRFLEDPVQGWARQVLGLGADDLARDPFARTDEPFDLPRTLALTLLRDTFLGWLASGEPRAALEARYAAAADRLELGGRLPTGVFGAALRTRHLAVLDTWAVRAREALEGRPARLARLELGRAARAEVPAVSLPVLELPSASVTGRSEATFEDGGCLVLVDRPLDRRLSAIRHELRAWLAQLAWRASGLPETGPWRAFVADPGDRLHRGALRPLSTESARDHLERLVQDLLTGPHVHLLPLETQLQLHAAQVRGHGSRRLQSILDRARPDGLGPLLGVPLRPPPLELALRIVNRRLGPLLEARMEGAR